MKTEKNTSSNFANYSVRNPRNVWIVRFFAFFAFVLISDFTDISGDRFPNSNEHWVNIWVAENGLDRPFIPLIDTQTEKLFAQKSPETKTYSKSIPKYSLGEVSKNPIKPSPMEDKISPEEVFLLSSNDVSILPITETRIEPQINFDAQIRISYAQRDAQFSNQFNTKPNKWYAGGSIGPQFANAVVSEPSASSYSKVTQIENLTSSNQGVSQNLNGNGFGAILNIGVEIGSGFEILTGVNFSQLSGNHTTYYDSEVQKNQVIFTSVNTSSSEGSRVMETVESTVSYTNYFSDTLESRYRVSSFEIPLIIKFRFGKQKLNYFVSSGISSVLGTSYNANFESIQIGNGNLNEIKYGLNTFNFILGAGVQYQASSSISVNISPTFKYGIPISENSLFQSNSSILGFLTGINYTF